MNSPRNTPPRILYVVNDPGFFLSHRLVLAEHARNAGFDVHVATNNTPTAKKISLAGLPYHPIPISRSGSHPLSELGTLISLFRLYRTLKPDLVHHVTIKPVLYGSLAARLAGIQAVVNAIPGLGHVFTTSGIKAAIRRVAVMSLYRLALASPNSRVIFQNNDNRDMFIKHGLITPQRTVLIRGAGVDLKEFHQTPEPDGPVSILLAARMLFDKGVAEFVEAGKILRDQGMDIKLILAGDSDPGNPASIPRETLRQWHNSGQVTWLGFHRDMAALLQKCHIACLPSYYGEGVPKFLIEAAASGRAIVTTDMPGCREIVANHKNGLLVPPKDPRALAHALKQLAKNPELRKEMGAVGRIRAVDGYSIEYVTRQTLALYTELINMK